MLSRLHQITHEYVSAPNTDPASGYRKPCSEAPYGYRPKQPHNTDLAATRRIVLAPVRDPPLTLMEGCLRGGWTSTLDFMLNHAQMLDNKAFFSNTEQAWLSVRRRIMARPILEKDFLSQLVTLVQKITKKEINTQNKTGAYVLLSLMLRKLNDNLMYTRRDIEHWLEAIKALDAVTLGAVLRGDVLKRPDQLPSAHLYMTATQVAQELIVLLYITSQQVDTRLLTTYQEILTIHNSGQGEMTESEHLALRDSLPYTATTDQINAILSRKDLFVAEHKNIRQRKRIIERVFNTEQYSAHAEVLKLFTRLPPELKAALTIPFSFN